MRLDSDTPTYNLRAVVQETGLKADTLRAWERRYGLPVPERSEGGHRLYSRRDIETLKWLIDRTSEGLSISRAVELWRNLEEAGEDPIADAFPPSPGQIQASVDAGSSLEELREAWIDAGLRFDEQAAEAILAQAFAVFPLETVTHQIMLPAVSEIGEKWFRGEASVQQEHFISQLALKRLNALLAAAPTPTRSEKIIVTCPPEEEHTVSLVLLTLSLRRLGFQVYYFGANTPVEQFDQAVASIDPDLIISSAQQLATMNSIASMAVDLYEKQIPFAFGGGAFTNIPDLQDKIPGHYLGDHLEDSYDQIENLTSKSQALEFEATSSNRFDQAYADLQEHRSEIIARGIVELSAIGVPEELARLILEHLNLSSLAAMRIGSLELLSYDLDWLEGLVENQLDASISYSSVLKKYLTITGEILDTGGDDIADLLRGKLGEGS